MAGILRRDIYGDNLNPTIGNGQAGFRPVLIISEDVFNRRSGTVIAMAVSSRPQKAGFPLTYKLAAEKLPKESRVKISQIRTLSVNRIGDYIGRIEPEELNKIIEGFNEIIGNKALWR